MTITTTAPLRGSAVRVAGLTKVYGAGEARVVALDAVDFARGRFTAIMGPSGSGKSTLMHCAAGLDRATSGQIWLCDKERGRTELSALSEKALTALRRDRVGFVFQAFNLLPTLDALGQQQRVACARALITRPDVVFADEPTGALDSTSSAEVLAFLRRSVDELGQTVIMVTHDPAAARYADDVVNLADGAVCLLERSGG